MLAPSLPGIEKKWTSFANYYATHFERCTLQVARVLYQVLSLEDNPETVLEVASGPGTCSFEVASTLSPSTKFAAIDYTPEMVQRTTTALSKLGPVSSELFSSSLSASRGDSQNLSMLSSDSVDRYMSNLCLQLIPDHEKMIKECFRVLKKGGRAAMTVWGKKELSNLFTILPQACANLGIESGPDTMRSNFHLGQDDKALREMFLSAGFSTVTLWHQRLVFEAHDAVAFVDTFLDVPSSVELLSSLVSEREIALREECLRLARECISSGETIGFDTIVIHCSK